MQHQVHDLDEEDPQQAKPARGLTPLAQPMQQERAEQELTHLPFRSWCPTCVANRGSADNHPKQESKNASGTIWLLLLQGSRRTNNNRNPHRDWCGNRHGYGNSGRRQTQDFQYHAQCSQSSLMECGRVQAVFNSTILQSDQEDHMIAVLQTAASKMGSNIIVRQSPAYSSQAQGSVDRFHRTLMGQIRTPRAQLQQNYDRTTASKHRIVPWLVRRPRIYSTGTQHTRIGNFPV